MIVDLSRHRRLAIGASVLLVPLVFVWLSESVQDTPILVDVLFFAVLAGLFLIPFTWMMRVAVPRRLGLRVAVSLLVLVLLAFSAAAISLWWTTARDGGRLWPTGVGDLRPSPPEIAPERCVEPAGEVSRRLESHLRVGESTQIAWYEVRLDEAEVVSPWIAVPTSPRYEPEGVWIGTVVRGSHSYRELMTRQWIALNDFEGIALLWTESLTPSAPVYAMDDGANGYRIRLFSLPLGRGESLGERPDIDLGYDWDSTATLAHCLIGEGATSIFQELASKNWSGDSTRIPEPLWYTCSNHPVYDRRCPNAITPGTSP